MSALQVEAIVLLHCYTRKVSITLISAGNRVLNSRVGAFGP